MNKYYTYLLKDPHNGEVFYVGKGCRSGRSERYNKHWQDVKAGRLPNNNNGGLFRRIKSIGSKPDVELVIEGVDQYTALAMEAAYIDFYGIDNLCNYQLGGIGQTMTEEIRAKIKEKTKKAMDKLPPYQGSYNTYKQYHKDCVMTYEEYVVWKINQDNLEAIRRDLKRRNREERDRLLQIEKNKRREERAEELKYRQSGPFIRQCPTCSKDIEHTSYESMVKSIQHGHSCRICGTLATFETNKRNGKWKTEPVVYKKEGPFIKHCPSCNKEQSYVSCYALQQAIKKKSKCNSCGYCVKSLIYND